MEKAPTGSNTSLEELIKDIEQLNDGELDSVLAEVLKLKAERSSQVLSKEESNLLEIINRSLTGEELILYKILKEKRVEEMLSPDDQQQLIDLTTKWEEISVERTKALLDLAKLKKVTLGELMDSLEIQAQYE